eukprot:182626-Amphidinium_carterae.1
MEKVRKWETCFSSSQVVGKSALSVSSRAREELRVELHNSMLTSSPCSTERSCVFKVFWTVVK